MCIKNYFDFVTNLKFVLIAQTHGRHIDNLYFESVFETEETLVIRLVSLIKLNLPQ